jgi:hypothetical protein
MLERQVLAHISLGTVDPPSKREPNAIIAIVSD